MEFNQKKWIVIIGRVSNIIDQFVERETKESETMAIWTMIEETNFAQLLGAKTKEQLIAAWHHMNNHERN